MRGPVARKSNDIHVEMNPLIQLGAKSCFLTPHFQRLQQQLETSEIARHLRLARFTPYVAHV